MLLARLETLGDAASQWLRVRIDRHDSSVSSWEPVTVPTGPVFEPFWLVSNQTV